MSIYAWYQGDNFIDLGTAEYLAELMHVKCESVKFYATPTFKKRHKDSTNGRIVIRVEGV